MGKAQGIHSAVWCVCWLPCSALPMSQKAASIIYYCDTVHDKAPVMVCMEITTATSTCTPPFPFDAVDILLPWAQGHMGSRAHNHATQPKTPLVSFSSRCRFLRWSDILQYHVGSHRKYRECRVWGASTVVIMEGVAASLAPIGNAFAQPPTLKALGLSRLLN